MLVTRSWRRRLIRTSLFSCLGKGNTPSSYCTTVVARPLSYYNLILYHLLTTQSDQITPSHYIIYRNLIASPRLTTSRTNLVDA